MPFLKYQSSRFWRTPFTKNRFIKHRKARTTPKLKFNFTNFKQSLCYEPVYKHAPRPNLIFIVILFIIFYFRKGLVIWYKKGGTATETPFAITTLFPPEHSTIQKVF